MDKEYEALQDLADADLIVKKSGIGKVNAAITATRLIMEHHPDCIISTGVAGGIDSSLHVTDIVVAENVAYHDYFIGEEGEGTELYKPFPCDANMIDVARNLVNTSEDMQSALRFGQIVTGDQFIQSPDELLAIKSRFPQALAVDMESCALAHVCNHFDVPFISFRIISDVVGVENHIEHYHNFWETLTNRSFDMVVRYIKSL